jgi:DNA excision repair protein ERCC-2
VAEQAAGHIVAVRALCEFTARRGDLDLRFTPAPTALEGVAGHQLVAARRPPHYQSEISLAGDYGLLRVRGRADGYDPHLQQLEEIKTHRGDLCAMPDNHRHLHWAQAKVYAWLMCRKLSLPALKVALVYFDVVHRTETVLVQALQADELERFFVEQCTQYLRWARLEVAHREQRDAQLQALPFAHPSFRDGQRSLAEAVYRAATNGRCLMAQAPTGIGKTIGTLFPLLKATAGRLDKIFYLTAKSSGRKLALDAVRQLRRKTPGFGLRVLELVARDKACEHPDRSCHGGSCPLARGFYDRLDAARSEALAISSMRIIQYKMCPRCSTRALCGRWGSLTGYAPTT